MLTQMESALILNAQNGDRNAFGELVCLHSSELLQILYRMYGNQQLAEDAVQKAFIQAWLQIPSFQVKTSFRAWLVRIAINAAIDMLRKDRRILTKDTDELPLTDVYPGPESVMIQKERAMQVRRAVLALPDASRAVLILREYHELPYHEIAEILEIPIGTVMSRLNYARKILKEKLELQMQLHEEVFNA